MTKLRNWQSNRTRIRTGPSTPERLGKSKILEIRVASYHQALQQAWYATALEATKSIFTLGSAGVGLSLTLIFGLADVSERHWPSIWLLFSTIVFSMAVLFCIIIFRANAKYILDLVNERDVQKRKGLIARLDLCSRIFFIFGLIFLIFAAVAKIYLKGA